MQRTVRILEHVSGGRCFVEHLPCPSPDGLRKLRLHTLSLSAPIDVMKGAATFRKGIVKGFIIEHWGMYRWLNVSEPSLSAKASSFSFVPARYFFQWDG